MGLVTSHDCWHGSYTAFDRWREEVAAVAGIDLWTMGGYTRDNPLRWQDLEPDVLHVLLNHSDCEGSIPCAVTEALAERLEGLIPALKQVPEGSEKGLSQWLVDRTAQFARGLRLAHAQGEDVTFW